MNKKMVMLPLMLLLVVVVPIALAQDIDIDTDIAVDVDLTWDGSGYLDILVDADDDASTYLYTGGFHIFGSLHVLDKENNPYGYGVDCYSAGLYATVEGGGYIDFGTIRLDSKESMYGPAGQRSESYIYTDDYAFMGWRTSTNYASLADCQYGWQSSDNFVASGEFEIGHALVDADGGYSNFWGMGEGTIEVDLMNSKSGGSSFTFGKGCGCYLNCDAEATGSGYFEVEAEADNYLKGDLGYEMPNGGFSRLSLMYTDGFTLGSFASNGN